MRHNTSLPSISAASVRAIDANRLKRQNFVSKYGTVNIGVTRWSHTVRILQVPMPVARNELESAFVFTSDMEKGAIDERTTLLGPASGPGAALNFNPSGSSRGDDDDNGEEQPPSRLSRLATATKTFLRHALTFLAYAVALIAFLVSMLALLFVSTVNPRIFVDDFMSTIILTGGYLLGLYIIACIAIYLMDFPGLEAMHMAAKFLVQGMVCVGTFVAVLGWASVIMGL